MLRGKKRKKILNPEIFLKDLKNFFEIIEKQTGLKSCHKLLQEIQKIQKKFIWQKKNFLW